MYKKTDPQRSIFSIETQLTASLRARLKGSWAELFRDEILPILLNNEDEFSDLYGKTGRPNFSVARMLGLCLLQELNNFNDQQALDTFGFDIRWRHALDIGNDPAIKSAEPYQLLVRLFHDQCEVLQKPAKGKTKAKKKIGIKRKSKGATLQSPHDPDASYGLKGCGYSAQVTETCNNKGKSLHAIFEGSTCRCCAKIEHCPERAPNNRTPGCKPCNTTGDFRLEITPQLRLRDTMYRQQQTDHWKDRYKIRSGIEATMSELKRSHGLGKLRVRRAAKVSFAVACKVIACNIKRWAKALNRSWDPILRLFLLIWGYLSEDQVKSIELASNMRRCSPNLFYFCT